MSIFKENLVPGMSFEQVIQWLKRNPAEAARTDLGRALLKLVKEGNTRALRRAWLGTKTWLAGKPVG